MRWGPLAAGPPFLVAFDAHPLRPHAETDLAAALARAGGGLGPFLPDAAVVGVGGPAARSAAARVPGVAWVGGLDQSGHRLCPRLADGLLGAVVREAATNASAPVALSVAFPRLEGAGKALPAGYDPAAAAEAEWGKALRQAVEGGGGGTRPPTGAEVGTTSAPAVVLARRGPLALDVILPSAAAAHAAAAWLAAQPAAHWVSAAPALASHNWQAAAITQSGKGAREPPAGPLADAGTHPLWAAGIVGSGQVAGGGDSGVDIGSCYFADPTSPFDAASRPDGTGVRVFESTTHRKVPGGWVGRW